MRCDIAFLVPSFDGGGAERVALNLLRSFSKFGLDCDLVLQRREGAYLTEVPKDVAVFDLGDAGFVRSIAAFRRYLRARRPRAVIAFMPRANVVAVVARFLGGAPTKVVLSEHNHLSTALRQTKPLRRWLIRLALVLSYRWADLVVTVSQGVKFDLGRVCRVRDERTRVIYNPIVEAGFDEKARMPVAHPWLQHASGKTMVAVGRLEPQKDYDTMLRAVARLPGDLDARLIVLGKGRELERLRCLAEELGVAERVDFVGFQANPLAFVARADVLVLSSRYEGFGNVLVEAMAVGTPVVSTDCPAGPREILKDGRYGPLVPVGDPDALAAGIEDALRNPVEPRLLAEAVKPFRADVIAKTYLEALQVEIRSRTKPIQALGGETAT